MSLETIVNELKKKYEAARSAFTYCLNGYDFNSAAIDWLYGDPAQKLIADFKAEYQREIRTNKASTPQLEEIVRIVLFDFLHREYLLFDQLGKLWLTQKNISDNGIPQAMEEDNELSVLYNGYIGNLESLIGRFRDRLSLTTDVSLTPLKSPTLADYSFFGDFNGDVSTYTILKSIEVNSDTQVDTTIDKQVLNVEDFSFYLNDDGKLILPFLKEQYNNAGATKLIAMMWALLNLSLLDINMETNDVNHTRLRDSLNLTFGLTQSRAAISAALGKFSCRGQLQAEQIKRETDTISKQLVTS